MATHKEHDSDQSMAEMIRELANEALGLATLIEKMKGAGDNAAVALDHKVQRIKRLAPRIISKLDAEMAEG